MPEDPLRYFRVEARELVERMRSALDRLEGGADTAPEVGALLRAAHTLKGAARVVRQAQIADASHALEDLLAPHREGQPIGDAAASSLVNLVADLERMLGELAPVRDEPLRAERFEAGPTEEPLHLLTAPQDVDDLLDTISSAVREVGEVRDVMHAAAHVRNLARALEAQVASVRGGASLPRIAPVAAELRLATAALETRGAASLARLEREIGDAKERAERLRLVPLGRLAYAVERTVDDIARALGKRVEVEVHGAELRVDAGVAGELSAALVQLARNAVVHGIEAASARQARGKEPVGRVTLRFARTRDQLECECSDDGAGIDLASVRRIAESRGLLASGASSQEVLRELLRGGVSTADTVSQHSGRGVGLDVVGRAATRLGAHFEVDTQPGRGTSIRMCIPTTLSGLAALVVVVGSQRVALPLADVEQTVWLSGAPGSVELGDGTVVRCAPLSRALFGDSGDERAPVAVIVRAGGGGRRAFAVAEVVGVTMVVARRVPAHAPLDAVVEGIASDERGAPLLVLSTLELVRAADASPPLPAPAAPVRLRVLVIDDSPTTRMLEKSILEGAGFSVDLAESGEEGLARFEQTSYACALIDVEMPGIDGFTVVERLRGSARHRSLPIIMVSSRDAEADRERGLLAGADDYVIKAELDQKKLVRRILELAGRAVA